MMGELLSKTLLFGLGALTVSKERAEEMMDAWVKKGEVSRDEARKIVEDYVEKGKKEKAALEEAINSEISKALGDANLASREDIQRLENKIEELKGMLEARG